MQSFIARVLLFVFAMEFEDITILAGWTRVDTVPLEYRVVIATVALFGASILGRD